MTYLDVCCMHFIIKYTCKCVCGNTWLHMHIATVICMYMLIATRLQCCKCAYAIYGSYNEAAVPQTCNYSIYIYGSVAWRQRRKHAKNSRFFCLPVILGHAHRGSFEPCIFSTTCASLPVVNRSVPCSYLQLTMLL